MKKIALIKKQEEIGVRKDEENPKPQTSFSLYPCYQCCPPDLPHISVVH